MKTLGSSMKQDTTAWCIPPSEMGTIQNKSTIR